jgi:hypothetical protein
MQTTELSGAPARVLLRRLGFCALFVMALVALPQLTTDPGLQMVIPGFVAMIFLQAAPAALARDKADLFAPPVYAGVLGAFAAVAQLAYFFRLGRVDVPLVPGLTPDEAADLATKTLLASCLGLVSYYAGYYHPWGRRWMRLFPKIRNIAWDPTRLLIAAIILFVMWGASYAYFQIKLGIPLFNFRELGAGKATWRQDPTLSWMLRGVQLGALPMYFYLALAAWKRRDTIAVLWLAALGVLGLLLLRLGQRGYLFIPLLGGLAIVHYLRKRIPTWVFAAALFVATIGTVIMYEWRTGYAAGGPETPGAATEKPMETLAAHEDERQRFGALAVVMHYIPAEKEYLLGESWLALIAVPVPRWLWPTKNEHFVWRDTAIVRNFTRQPIPTGYTGLLYANFGWLGIALGMMLWGLFQRGLYEWMLSGRDDPTVVLLYTMFLLHFGFTMLAISAAVQFLLPTWILCRWLAVKNASGAGSAA